MPRVGLSRGGEDSVLEEGFYDLSDIEEKATNPNQWGLVGVKTLRRYQ